MKTQPLSDLPSSLYRASAVDSETECSTESDEMDSDSGYGIGRRRTSYCCAARPPLSEQRHLPVCLEHCTSIPLSATERLVLVPPTSVSCTAGREVDAGQTAYTATTTRRHHDDMQTANIGVNTAASCCQQTAQAPACAVSNRNSRAV